MDKVLEKLKGARLLVIDRNPLELIGLKTILCDCSIKVYSEDELVHRVLASIIEEWEPQAVLADVSSYDQHIDSFTRVVRRRFSTPVLWLTASSDDDAVLDAVMAGAAGCAPKDDFNTIAKAVGMILGDDVAYSAKALAAFAFEIGLLFPPTGRHIKNLTNRERLIFMLMREGATNHQIASELLISVETVKAHIRSIRQTYGALSKRQLVPQAFAGKEPNRAETEPLVDSSAS